MVELNGTSAPASDSHTGNQIDQIAISPTAPDQVANLAQTIASLSKSFTAGESGARLQLLEAADSLLSALETPRETILRYCWRNVGHFFHSFWPKLTPDSSPLASQPSRPESISASSAICPAMTAPSPSQSWPLPPGPTSSFSVCPNSLLAQHPSIPELTRP